MNTRHGVDTFPLIVLFLLLGLGFLSGCASTGPGATFRMEMPKEKLVDANDTVEVSIETIEAVPLLDHEKTRLVQTIKMKVNEHKAKNVEARDSKQYELKVLITEYDKGNAFARFMLAGLGQIHINGQVTVLLLPSETRVAEFDIDKAFAWGGFYGMNTTIEDVEEGFAEGIAEAVTERDE